MPVVDTAPKGAMVAEFGSQPELPYTSPKLRRDSEHCSSEEWHVECYRQDWLWVGLLAGTVPIRVAGFVLLAACGAFCQQLSSRVAPSSLPDAPSSTSRTDGGQMFTGAVGSPRPITSDLDVAGDPSLGSIARRAPTGFALIHRAAPVQETSGDFFDKYLYPTLLKRNLSYHPSTSTSFVGRTMYAASRIFVTRDDSGRGRVNTPYFVGVLASAAIHMANRPSWNRSASTPFSDFGSTIGNDAGMNLLHEFRPGLEQLMKSHAPRFVAKIEERVAR